MKDVQRKKLTFPFLLLLAACGTIVGGTSQDISFDSNIKGVKIFIDGVEVCKTPCVYPMDRQSSSAVVQAKKTGYEDKQIVLRSGINRTSFLNLTFWPSWLTDVATGGIWQYNSNGVYVDTEKSTTKRSELRQIQKNVAVRRFALFNYGELKIEAAAGKTDGEYLTALSELSETPKETLLPVIRQTRGEVNLAHTLTLR